MERITRTARFIGMVLALCATPCAVGWAQQLSTATLSGTVKDSTGGALPGATIALTSATRGTAVPPVVSGPTGEFLVPNLAPDTYDIEVTLDSFKTLKRTGIALSGGDRMSLGDITMEIGGVSETVEVTAGQTFIQAESGERSFTVAPKAVESLPVANRSFTALAALAPGVTGANPTSIGGGGAPNVMMDGIGTFDPGGRNRPSLQMNVESIAEVKLVTSSYQAEYGQSGGIQVLAVTKGGSNQFHGSLYDVERNSDWYANTKTNILNGNPKPQVRERDLGYSIGGPIGKPGGQNKLFFFYAQEYAPRNNGGGTTNFRVPTAAERAGDFSQSTDNNGNLFNLIRDASTGLPCTAANHSGCFQADGVLGKIPADRLYPLGQNILNLYPLPNVATPGAAFNYTQVQPNQKLLATEPAFKIDYQALKDLRVSFKYSGWRQRQQTILGTLPGFNDTIMSHPVVDTWASSANYAISPSTFFEITYGQSRLELVGCAPATNGSSPVFCQRALPVSDAANPNNVGLGDLPLLFPDANILDPSTHMAYLLQTAQVPIYQDGRVEVLPSFAYGSRVANAPPSITFPGGGAMNRVDQQNLSLSLTKIVGRHTFKVGYYQSHISKVQQGAAGSNNGTFAGAYDFAQDANNPLDSGFGFANAALGIFDTMEQTSAITEGKNGNHNYEAYAQDTWRMTDTFTLDYGLRFVSQEPQHDEYGTGSNFLPDKWEASAAPILYAAGCPAGVTAPCPTVRQAINPVTGELAGPNSASLVGTIVPGTGDAMNGLRLFGQGINSIGIESPALRLAPRAGVAYDLSGDQKFVLRGGAGVFYSRAFLNATSGNPPFVQDVTARFGQMQSLNPLSSGIGVSQVGANEYIMPYPTDVQWSGGVQMALPLATVLDVSYVGHHSWNEINNVNINAIDIGSAFEPQNVDPTLNAGTPGANAVSVQQLQPYRGYGRIDYSYTNGWRTFHSIQLSVNRRFSRGLSFGINDTIDLYEHANTTPRFQHDASGAVSLRQDQTDWDALMSNAYPVVHTIKGNFVWDLPDLGASGPIGRTIGAIVNDWQLSGIWTASTGSSYTVGFNYASAGQSINLTGSPDYAARIRIVGDPGDGCSSNPLEQFNTSAFAGPLPNSVGLESGAGYLRGCFQSALDLAVARSIPVGGSRTAQIRVDIFNAPNQAIITGRNATMNLSNPGASTVATNLPIDANGAVIPTRAIPNGAGFGVANAYQSPRTVQLQLRFSF